MTAVMEKKPKKEIKYTTIFVDVETHARLKKAASGVPLSRYLRELSVSMTGEIESPIARRLARIEGTLADLGIGMWHYNKAGKLVPVQPMEEANGTQIPWIPCSMIQSALEENPEARRVGWYIRNDAGEWEFDQEGFDRWAEQDAADKDAIDVAMEYLDNEAKKAGKSHGVGEFMKYIDTKASDWYSATRIGRDKLIELGRKLMEQRKGGENEA